LEWGPFGGGAMGAEQGASNFRFQGGGGRWDGPGNEILRVRPKKSGGLMAVGKNRRGLLFLIPSLSGLVVRKGDGRIPPGQGLALANHRGNPGGRGLFLGLGRNHRYIYSAGGGPGDSKPAWKPRIISRGALLSCQGFGTGHFKLVQNPILGKKKKAIFFGHGRGKGDFRRAAIRASDGGRGKKAAGPGPYAWKGLAFG